MTVDLLATVTNLYLFYVIIQLLAATLNKDAFSFHFFILVAIWITVQITGSCIRITISIHNFLKIPDHLFAIATSVQPGIKQSLAELCIL